MIPWMPELYGLIAAVTWGAGDYSGGIATKRTNVYSVVIFAHLASMLILVALAFILHDPFPPIRDWLWGGLAGLGGGFGLILLYIALATGKMAVVAPISALVAAAIPVIFAWITNGPPGMVVSFGFLLAFISIWLLSGSGSLEFAAKDLQLPVAAGIAFGFFFLCLHQASTTSIVFPLIAVRVVSISSILIYAMVKGQRIIPKQNSWLPILCSGLFDTIGNGAFALASQLGRVDSAAVLGSLYPGSTVLLAYLILKEHISKTQVIGICVALFSIILITAKL